MDKQNINVINQNMVQFEDIEKLQSLEDEVYKPTKTSLLIKYQIPLHHLDFDYVAKCENAKEIEKIYKVLKSGEEGYYPDLLKVTENKLKILKPSSKYLREVCPVLQKSEVAKEEWNHLSNDLSEWMEDVQKKDTELCERKIKTEASSDVDIRKSKPEIKKPIASNAKRIASTDYESWDKYDPDTEILKMDLHDEKVKKEALETQDKLKKSKIVRFSNFATETEALYEANNERERGNECFKAGEFKNALQHYTYSIQCKPLAVCFTNRAVTYIKLKKYELAIKDCKEALKLEPNCFKAYLRLAQSYEELKEYEEGLKHIIVAIEIDPNNTSAQETANRLYKVTGVASCGNVNKTRFSIEDIESTNSVNSIKPLKPILKFSKSNEKAVIPIPGSSSMPPPYFVEVPTADPEVIKREEQKILSKPQLLHMTTIDPPSDDEFDLISKMKSGKEMDTILSNKNSSINLDKGHFGNITKVNTSSVEKHLSEGEVNNIKNSSKKDKEHKPVTKECSQPKMKDKDANLKPNISNLSIEPEKISRKETNIKENNLKHTDFISDVSDIKPQMVSLPPENIPDGQWTWVEDVKGAGGEPHTLNESQLIISEEDLQSPYTFSKVWNAVKKDTTYTKQAEILRKLDFHRIHEVIGYNLDEDMLSGIIQSLHRHFMVPSELDKVRKALSNFNRIPRFQMILLFLSSYDRKCIKQLMEFLDQHERNLENSVKEVYTK